MAGPFSRVCSKHRYASYYGKPCPKCATPDPRDAEISRLTAERDAARAETEMAFEVAADHCWNKRDLLADVEKKQVAAGLTGRDYYGRRLEAELLSRSIRALPPAHATAALAARDKATREQALKEFYSVLEAEYDQAGHSDATGIGTALRMLEGWINK